MTTIDDDDEECENAPDFRDNIMKIGTISAALKTQKTYERRSDHSQKFRIIARSARHDPKVAMSFLATVCDHGSEIKLREVRLLVAIPNDQQALPPQSHPARSGVVGAETTTSHLPVRSGTERGGRDRLSRALHVSSYDGAG